jgi:two-component system sensor histidine kinase KdpD
MPRQPEPARPDPDDLLRQVKAQEARALRGKLKIFFGAAAGVGKTYAMLEAARQLRLQGLDVVVGLVETHGRAETAALLAGLEQLPAKEMDYLGRKLREFDLDGALARRPGLLLVDELAHSNVPGSRHPKRWQDIEELIAAGIDVWTTVNVQHLESLNDIVGGITGVKVGETLPDRLLDEADEIVLVDLPPDELLKRLREGKVYLPQQAARAIHNFFRKGNLIALRELALRRTAERVDDEMKVYRTSQSIRPVWKASEALLAAVGPAPASEAVVRAAARLAAQLDAAWHAVYVETPSLKRLSKEEREAILATLGLAEKLGAETATLSGADAAGSLAEYARRHNLGRILLGRETPTWLSYFRRSLGERLERLAPEIDLLLVALPDKGSRAEAPKVPFLSPPRRPQTYLRTFLASLATAAAAAPLANLVDPANVAMLFVLSAALVGRRYGEKPAIFAAVINVLLFNYFFVPPILTFAVKDAEYVLTFAVMLITSLVAGHLTAGLRFQVTVAQHRELRARRLYEMARELSSALRHDQLVEISERHVGQAFDAPVALLLPDGDGRILAPEPPPRKPGPIDASIAQWVYDHREPAGLGADTLPGSPLLYWPLATPIRSFGVLAIELPAGWRTPEQKRWLEALAALIALALERIYSATVAREAMVHMESERLRNSLLGALSHDLRTPLTVLVGLAESLLMKSDEAGLKGERRETAEALRDEALRTSILVDNLLDMVRLDAGKVELHKDWLPLEEVVGSALRSRELLLAHHAVRTDLPEGLPLVEIDAVLIERVLCNLVENAAKYSPPGTVIRIAAREAGDRVEVSVEDEGPGLPPGSEERLFEKFVRGRQEDAITGVGLGLAICRAIVRAHGGEIRAENIVADAKDEQKILGARFVFGLPLGSPPPVEAESPGEASR